MFIYFFVFNLLDFNTNISIFIMTCRNKRLDQVGGFLSIGANGEDLTLQFGYLNKK